MPALRRRRLRAAVRRGAQPRERARVALGGTGNSACPHRRNYVEEEGAEHPGRQRQTDAASWRLRPFRRGMNEPGMSVRRPSAAFAASHPAHIIALGFGAGLAPFAPGTAGTLLAWPIGAFLGAVYPPGVVLAAAAVCFVIGIW